MTCGKRKKKLYACKHCCIPRMAVQASSMVLCFASSASVTTLFSPPVPARSFPLRLRRIQSNSEQPGPSALLRGDLLPGTLLVLGLEGGGGDMVSLGAAAKFGSVICFRTTVGLEGGVLLVTVAREGRAGTISSGDAIAVSSTTLNTFSARGEMYVYLLPANALQLFLFIRCFSVTPPIFWWDFF